jgi:hypothetical protein
VQQANKLALMGVKGLAMHGGARSKIEVNSMVYKAKRFNL